MDKTTFTKLVREFRFKELFNQMGWDNASGSFEIDLKGTTYTVQVICEKSGFRFLQCSPPPGASIPPKNERMRLQSIVKRRFYEHMLIFIDDTKQKQIWQYAYKPAGKPLKTIITEYPVSQDPQLLYQRTSGLVFNIDEHENITLVDVTKRLNAVIDQNSETVTKKFYDGFKRQHTNFKKYMTGIDEELDRNWYTSVLLNRLMFCYFIQKRGFLDNNVHYLLNKLQDGQLEHGRDQFYSFYRNFLLQLFHDGLGSPDREHLSTEFGKIPYLNGGIFSLHELESKYEGQIRISDDAFESLFKFFEEYNWHLDTKITASGRDINPDVIGYIFEKYINDRAQMGAYYTKEDITDYIGKNTILPYLFDEVQRKLPSAFNADGEIWQMLQSSEDQYIYSAVKHGINPNDIWHDLPDDIKAGMDPDQENLVELRRSWNRPAQAEIALPTEIWREVISRRQRYLEVKTLISNGSITQINDFITYNLDIRQFALDLITETDDHQMVFQFYKALNSITILDPTCGSGAFLFAAMNILEDLYEACINRMRDFVTDNPGHSTSHMKRELDIVDNPSHPNLEYFVYKSIILNNLYGVDIMNEAVEIAKLRLFLKLVACVDPDPSHLNFGLEPLPDIDFNIRCGNTLVGYVSNNALNLHLDGDLLASLKREELEIQSKIVALAFKRFKEMQLVDNDETDDFVEAKELLNNNLRSLTDQLDQLLHQKTSTVSLALWKQTSVPFHWFAEFYDIINSRGGFSVIIGNPPYVEDASYPYRTVSCVTGNCGNVYAYITERVFDLLHHGSNVSLVVPISLTSSQRMTSLRDFIESRSGSLWFSNYSLRPQSLFKNVMQRITIFISHLSSKLEVTKTTNYTRWTAIERDYLFEKLYYTDVLVNYDVIPKANSAISNSVLTKFHSFPTKIGAVLGFNKIPLYYHDSGESYWTKAVEELPLALRNNVRVSPSQWFEVVLPDFIYNHVLVLVNSSLFYLLWTSLTDCRHMTKKFLLDIRVLLDSSIDVNPIATKIITEIRQNTSSFEKRPGYVSPQIRMNKVKDTIDQVDKYLAEYYGFTDEELDYIVNYDIKYRMGSNLKDVDDDDLQDSGL